MMHHKENLRIYQLALVLKSPSIWTYGRIDIRAYVRSTKNIISEKGVRMYVRVATTVIFDGYYVTDPNFITTYRIGVRY